ncbi:MAG: hypothetical protein H6R10_1056 [Rhodocyclaceae bacterium]|nr:hypothetical protein [Rhodocyclaceae bacterium]
MAIEIRQMIVKTTVVHHTPEDGERHRSDRERAPSRDFREVLEQCRRMVSEMLQERRER